MNQASLFPAITTSTPAFSGVVETSTTRALQAFHDGSFMALEEGPDTTLVEGREPGTRGAGTASKATKVRHTVCYHRYCIREMCFDEPLEGTRWCVFFLFTKPIL